MNYLWHKNGTYAWYRINKETQQWQQLLPGVVYKTFQNATAVLTEMDFPLILDMDFGGIKAMGFCFKD